MEQPQSRRGFWGATFSLFGRTPTSSAAESTDSDGTTPSRRTAPLAAQEPESPAKRASDVQMQSRKILGRPQGPSSKLAQTLNASDFTKISDSPPNLTGTYAVPDDDSNSSSPVVGRKALADTTSRKQEFRMPGDMPGKVYNRKSDLPWKSKSMYERTGNLAPGSTPYKAAPRMPGDNPYKTIGSSSVNHRPIAAAFPPRGSLYGSSTLPNNVFRESMKRPSIPSFSPKIPANTLKQSFPPSTPGKPPRGSVADVNGRAMRQEDTVELFDMRIPNPPEDLSGEALAKQVPDSQSRVGSVYADEFLAHYCPDDFDDLQRRQFFCILDLRRLKYAADEIFVKKDWKLNVLNFAKEYEKSRSLIMLRYGLYEFKTIRASEATTKEWKQKHGIADPDEEKQAVVINKPNNIGSKRKAEDDLSSKDTALTASSTNLNKRARPESVAQTKVSDSNKNKRKASVSGPDENQPSKLAKAASPAKPASLTRTLFENVANNSPNAKPPPKKASLFSATAAKAPNGTARSVFDSTAKPAITHNIFGQLSDTSKGSGNEADSDSDAEDDGEPESEQQEASQSDEPSVVASGGVATPQFGGLLPKVNGTSSASSDAGDSTKSRSLFDRVTRDDSGQPVKSLVEPAKPEEPVVPDARSTSPIKDGSATPASAFAPAASANKTWNPDTPIKFSSTTPAAATTTPGGFTFGAAQKPAPAATFSFGAPAAKKADEPAAPAPDAAKPASTQPGLLFGAAATKSDSAPPLFGVTAKSDSASSLFGGAAKPASSAPIKFGSTPAFGQPKDTEKPADTQDKKESSAPAPATPLFGAKPPSTPAGAPLFGGAAAAPAPLFGSTTPAADSSKPNVFQSSTLFGSAPKVDAPKASEPSSLFKAPTEQGTKASTPAPSLFANTPNKGPAGSEEATNVFGSMAKSVETPAANLFGGSASKPAANLFGGVSTTPATKAETGDERPVKKAFGQTSGSLFGNSSTPAPAISFGTPSATTPAISFGASSKSQEPVDAMMASPDAKKTNSATNGVTSTPSATGMFSFGSTTPAATPFGGSQSTGLFGGSSQQSATQPASQSFTAAPSTFSFTAGGVNNPFASGGTASAPQSFNFGASTNANTSAPSSFTFGSTPAPSFSFGGDSKPADSNGGSSSFVFGGSSSAAPTGSTPNADGGGLFAFGGAQNSGAGSIFGNHLAPGGGTSTGTNSPFTFGGASSLATTPATGTPEPGTETEDAQKKATDDDGEKQAQISLTDGGPGEEDESVVHEVRAKALKLVTKNDKDDEDDDDKKNDKNPWKVQGVGPLRLLKHKTTGAVRILLRAEPRGSIAMNKAILPNFTYKPESNGGKYVKITTSSDDGSALETWMIQVKTPALAKELADALEANKDTNKK